MTLDDEIKADIQRNIEHYDSNRAYLQKWAHAANEAYKPLFDKLRNVANPDNYPYVYPMPTNWKELL